MALRLQKFDIRSSNYERPTHPWVCGHAAAGHPCRLGPAANGQCRTTAECEPTRVGDRWVCKRPASTGGPCASGPLPDGTCSSRVPPCRPVRNMRRSRGHAAVWLAGLTTILLALGLGFSEFANAILEPGALSFHHRSIEDCGTCHTKAQGGPLAWLGAAVSPTDAASMSGGCLECHRMGPDAISPHNLPPASMASITDHARPAEGGAPLELIATRALFGGGNGGGSGGGSEAGHDVACTTCHTEHTGSQTEITDVEDNRCQICHKAQFQSFADGHPVFDPYPHNRRTRIFFDHVSHIQQHFAKDEMKDKAPNTCTDCHDPDPTAQALSTGSFADTCAACHGGQVDGSERVAGTRGVPVFAAVGFDLESLREHGVGIGQWPSCSEAEITPIMTLLLANDPQAETDLATLADLDLLDLTDASDEQLAAVSRVAWGIKTLLRDLIENGPDGLQARLDAALGQELDIIAQSRLAASMPRDLLLGIQRDWYPALYTDVAKHAAGETVQTSEPFTNDATCENPLEEALEQPLDGESWAELGGWYRQYYVASYRPVEHSDRFLRTWIDVAGLAYGTPAEAKAAPLFAALSDKRAPGVCTKCHSVDREADGTLNVKWKGRRVHYGDKHFTKFDHAPHLIAMQDRGCTACHEINPKAAYQEAYKGNDPHTFASNFEFLENDLCETCHVDEHAGDSCVQCHNYHIGDFEPALPQTSME
jgi:hypothetical protein